ncbi:MAG: hypothetical protein HYZ58_08050 [Acidobacteria bacterium]|nr:hypothetical protein [Acidobacteriota bacterium]
MIHSPVTAFYRLLAAMVLLSISLGVSVAAQPRGQRSDGDRLLMKMGLIVQNSLQTRPRRLRTSVTESELNAFLAYQAKDQMPSGVVQPEVSILGDGKIAGRAIVDMEAARKQQGGGGWLDPWSYLGGRVPLAATGTLQTRNGVGTFALEYAEISGVIVPKALLQQVVSYYSRTPENPRGIDLDAPFELPARIREIEVQRGQAILVQ